MEMREKIEKTLKESGIVNFTQLCGLALNIDPAKGSGVEGYTEYLIALKQLLDEEKIRRVWYSDIYDEDGTPIEHAEWVGK